MSYCSVKWRGKNSRTSSFKKDGITFHRFPKCPEKKSKWIESTFRGEAWFPNKNSVICSRHFTEDCFHVMKDRRRLMDSAVPSLYLSILQQLPQNENSFDENAEQKSDKESVPSSSSIPHKQDISCGSETPTRKRKLNPLPDTPSAYDSPTKKRLCRRIIELKTTVKIKNKALKRVRDCNRRLKRKIISLKSLLAELQNKNLITTENREILSSVGVKCRELIKRQMIQRKSAAIIRKKYSPELRAFALTLNFYSTKG